MRIKKPSNIVIPKKEKALYEGMSIDTNTLGILCRYIISDSNLLRLSNISKLNRLISSIDPKTYNTDPDKLKRITFIKKGIDARLGYKLTDDQMIITHILSQLNFDPDFIDLENSKLNIDEIAWANEHIIENSNKFGFIFGSADKFLDICTRIKSSDYSHRGDLATEFEDLIDITKNEFRKANTDHNAADMEFSLAPGEFESTVSEIYDIVTSPSRRLVCGLQGLNIMTGGGFESERIYMFLGITGAGKSITLLDIMLQMKKYNKHYQLKDPSKRPCILYLTMENTVAETVTRLFSMLTGNNGSMINYSKDDVINKLKTEGQLILSIRVKSEA